MQPGRPFSLGGRGHFLTKEVGSAGARGSAKRQNTFLTIPSFIHSLTPRTSPGSTGLRGSWAERDKVPAPRNSQVS